MATVAAHGIPLWDRYTPQMKRVHHRLRAKGGLQAYLQREVPTRGVEEVAVELKVHFTTLYRWIDLLFVRGNGPHLVPLAELQEQQAEVAAEAAEAERREAVAELARMRLVEAGETEG